MPQAAPDIQIEMSRRMTLEKRSKLAVGLCELACKVAGESIRPHFPCPMRPKSNAASTTGWNWQGRHDCEDVFWRFCAH